MKFEVNRLYNLIGYPDREFRYVVKCIGISDEDISFRIILSNDPEIPVNYTWNRDFEDMVRYEADYELIE